MSIRLLQGSARRTHRWTARAAALSLLATGLLGITPVDSARAVDSAASSRSAGGVTIIPAGDSHGRGVMALRDRPDGRYLTWRSPTRLPVLDSRPEFRVGTQVVGSPTIGTDGRTLSLPLAALDGFRPSQIQVWMGLRRLDSTVQTLPSSGGTAGSDVAGTVTPPDDPGKPGPYDVEAFDYSAPDLPWRQFESPMEVLGHAVLPVGVDHAPLVLFLHGRHYYCYGPGDTGQWPCTGRSKPIPSYLGYDYLQRLLASQGYATVSISANAINAQDGRLFDGGARARGALVQHHLALLTGWSSDPNDQQWGGRLDMSQVVLVGHSRGGEGVDQAAIDLPATVRYHLAGQILLAPTDFGYQTAPYLPTELLLSYCDGDVSDLQGQRYVDAAQLLTDDDPTLRSSVLLRGANHNFFNTEWTPGISQAPSFDDWGDRKDPLCGDKVSDTRLTAKEQRRAAKTFVAAGVHAFLGNETTAALAYLDSGEPVAIPEAGPALAWTHALGGRRVTDRLGDGATVAGDAEPCRAGTPQGDWFAGAQLPLCGGTKYYRQVHWTPAATDWPSVHSAYAAAGLPRHAVFSWTTAGAEGGFSLARTVDLSAADSRLDLRVVMQPHSAPVTFQVVLGAGGTEWAGPERTLSALPGSRFLAALWGQTIRIDPADYAGHLDLANIDTVLLRAQSASGTVWLLDASRRMPGLDPVPEESLPRIRLGRIAQPEGPAGADGVAKVPFRVIGQVSAPAQFAIAAEQSTWDEQRPTEFTTVTVEPGQTSGTIAVPYEADDLADLPRQRQLVFAVPRQGVTASGYIGTAVILDDDPRPDVTFAAVDKSVVYGDPIVYRVTLSAPVDFWVVNRLRAMCFPNQVPLRTSDIPRKWLHAEMGRVPRDVPLCDVWHYGFVDFPPGQTTVEKAVPTVANPPHIFGKRLTVRLNLRNLSAPLHATAKVTMPE